MEYTKGKDGEFKLTFDEPHEKFSEGFLEKMTEACIRMKESDNNTAAAIEQSKADVEKYKADEEQYKEAAEQHKADAEKYKADAVTKIFSVIENISKFVIPILAAGTVSASTIISKSDEKTK